MAVQARKTKKGVFEIIGLEKFIESRVAELKHVLAKKAAGTTAPKKKISARPVTPARKLKLSRQAMTQPSSLNATWLTVGCSRS